MADVLPLSSEEHLALVKAQAPIYLKKASDLTYRRRLWLSMLRRYGMIEANANSHSLVWNVEYSEPEVRQYADAGDLEFNEHDALQQLVLDVRGYTATDRITEKQKLMNGGSAQVDDLYKNKTDRLLKRVNKVLCGEMYVDGNATGNSNRFMGVNSFLGDDGATVAADQIARPSDSYAGRSTAPGADGGTYSSDGTSYNATMATDFPFGSGDVEYDYLLPLLVNISSTGWKAGTTFDSNCEEIMRFARIAQVNRGAKLENSKAPFIHMLGADMYADFLNFYSARNRQVVPHAESANLGFGDTMNFEGDAVHYEYDCPSGEGYGFVPTMMELFHLGPQLINSRGPEWAITKMAYLYLIYVFGNLRCQPKFFVKYKSYA